MSRDLTSDLNGVSWSFNGGLKVDLRGCPYDSKTWFVVWWDLFERERKKVRIWWVSGIHHYNHKYLFYLLGLCTHMMTGKSFHSFLFFLIIMRINDNDSNKSNVIPFITVPSLSFSYSSYQFSKKTLWVLSI